MDDNYPEKGRRNFVKKVVGAGVLGSVGTVGFMSYDMLTQQTGEGGGQVTYNGIELLAGPAPRGMPQIPLEIGSNGEIIGVAPPEGGRQIADFNYSMEWFQYCGVQGYPGVRPGFESENRFRYNSRNWHEDRAGEVMNVDHFSDWESYQGSANNATEGIGKPAWGTWRSQGVDQTMPVAVIKTDKQRLLDNAPNQSVEDWIDATVPQGFIGWLNKCTHFCCVPQGFQTSDYGCGGGSDPCSGDLVYCQCHQSIYDPFSIVTENMIALPRPETD